MQCMYPPVDYHLDICFKIYIYIHSSVYLYIHTLLKAITMNDIKYIDIYIL